MPMLMTRLLSIVQQDNPSDKDVNQGTLVVFNLDASVSNDDLRMIFGSYGEVKEVSRMLLDLLALWQELLERLELLLNSLLNVAIRFGRHRTNATTSSSSFTMCELQRLHFGRSIEAT